MWPTSDGFGPVKSLWGDADDFCHLPIKHGLLPDQPGIAAEMGFPGPIAKYHCTTRADLLTAVNEQPSHRGLMPRPVKKFPVM